MELIFYNAVVHTMAGKTAQAVAVQNGSIAAVGGNEEILALGGPETKRIDLNGKCLLPGFNDSHCHLLLTGTTARALDLRGTASLEDIIARGKDYIKAKKPPEGAWIIGYGFDQNLFPGRQLPTKETADAITTRHPLLLDRVCGHVGTLNTKGLEVMGYDEKTSFPGGILDKGADGRLNGILREVALDTCRLSIPMPDVRETKKILKELFYSLNAMGITSVQTDDLWSAPLDTLLQAFQELAEENACTLRVYEEAQAARMPQLEEFLARGLRTGDGSPWFKIGNIKLIADGSLGARTAYLNADYADAPGDRGVPVYTQEALDEMVATAHNAGMQVAFHAIGDGALEQCVSAVEKAQEKSPKELRHRIVHCQIGSPQLYRRLKAAGMCADIQPAFTPTDAPLVQPRLGEERAKHAYAWKTLVEMGIPLGGGSDSPVETFCPIWGIACAVNPVGTAGSPLGEPFSSQALSVEQAVSLYTAGSAYLEFQENNKGTIEPGKLADFVILDQDIMKTPPGQLSSIQVEMTVSNGRICYEKNSSSSW